MKAKDKLISLITYYRLKDKLHLSSSQLSLCRGEALLYCTLFKLGSPHLVELASKRIVIMVSIRLVFRVLTISSQ